MEGYRQTVVVVVGKMSLIYPSSSSSWQCGVVFARFEKVQPYKVVIQPGGCSIQSDSRMKTTPVSFFLVENLLDQNHLPGLENPKPVNYRRSRLALLLASRASRARCVDDVRLPRVPRLFYTRFYSPLSNPK